MIKSVLSAAHQNRELAKVSPVDTAGMERGLYPEEENRWRRWKATSRRY